MSGKVGSTTGTGSAGKRDPAERSPVAVGDVVADKYRVEQIVAAGGMGVVVAARHTQLGQLYAVKFLLPDAKHEAAVERFLREARAAARIESTHVCRVFDCGTLPDGIPYMVMEHLVGHDLSHELKTRGRLPVAEAVDLLLQAIEGIAEAHAEGIVHRDLKPSNLFLGQKPGRAREVKVLDFGISKLAPGLEEDVEEDLTATEAMLGSPRYMSPEQVQDAKTVDHRTDIWSLGVILYQMLDGKSPFAGTTMGETIGKVLLHVPPPIREVRGDVPDGVGAVIDRCLARDRDARYRNVAELALALAPFATQAAQPSIQRITALLVDGKLGSGSGTGARAAPLLAAAPSYSSIELTAPYVKSPSSDEPSVGTVGPVTQGRVAFRPKRTGLFIGLGALVLAAIGFVVLLVGRAPDPPTSPAASAKPAPSAAPASTASTAPTAPEPEPAPKASASAPTPTPAPEAADAAPAPSESAAPNAKKPATKNVKKGVARPGKGGDDLLSESY
jgi:serine/threonine protein kinase